MIDESVVQALRELLSGTTVSACANDSHFLVLQFGNVTLRVFAKWVVRRDFAAVLADSECDAPLPEVTGSVFRSLDITNELGDFVLLLDPGLVIEANNDAPEHESWHVTIDGKIWLVVGPGEMWSSWDVDP